MDKIALIRIGIIAHDDYCDERSTYVIKKFDISDHVDVICDFVQNVEPTGGGDAPECYELVLNETQLFLGQKTLQNR